jgi:hypothetical protein
MNKSHYVQLGHAAGLLNSAKPEINVGVLLEQKEPEPRDGADIRVIPKLPQQPLIEISAPSAVAW